MIVFTKDLLTLNPAYNDNIIQFSSTTVTGATKAVISLDGNLPFEIVPFNGVFTFNFKDIIKSFMNTNKFEDEIIPDLINNYFVRSDQNIVKTFSFTVSVHNALASESVNKSYTFSRGVEQLPNYHRLAALAPSVRVLLPTKNYMDYNVRMFEGYPFDFGVYGIGVFNNYYLKNLTTNQQTEPNSTTNSSVKRFYLSDGANNTTDTNILINSSTLNRIELYVNNIFRANVNITKVESKCGVYLKWLNSKGSYSYWLFDSIYKDTITPKTIDDFIDSYDNLQNVTSTSHLIGKTASNTLALNTTFDNIDADYLKDLIYSPAVWMYAHQVPFQQVQDKYDWIGVKVSDSPFPLDNKTSKNKLGITITLPAMNTITN